MFVLAGCILHLTAHPHIVVMVTMAHLVTIRLFIQLVQVNVQP